MSKIKRVLLDVLKPHTPNILVFAQSLADLDQKYQVRIDVKGVDEKTETVFIEIEGEHIDYTLIDDVVSELGGSVHSIDRVEVHGN